MTCDHCKEIVPVGIAEIAELTGYKRQYVDTLRHRKRLPEPWIVVSGNPLWHRADIESWMAERITNR